MVRSYVLWVVFVHNVRTLLDDSMLRIATRISHKLTKLTKITKYTKVFLLVQPARSQAIRIPL